MLIITGKKEQLKCMGVMTLIIFCTYIVGTREIQLPGLYYDAVYPDYLAAIGAFPGKTDNFTQITRHNGLPLLGNFYHGTMTAAIQWIVLKIVGYASVETLRLVNLGYIALLGCIVYMMGRRTIKNNIVPAFMAILCVTSQNILTISRTQYYIMLPGCICFMLSVTFLVSGIHEKDKRKIRNLFMSGIFQGLAFYGYFSFLFLALGSVFILIWKEKGIRIRSMAAYLWGIPCGSIFYFLGYYDSLVTNLFGESVPAKIILILGAVIILVVLGIPGYAMLISEKSKIRKAVIRIYTVGICLGAAGGGVAVGSLLILGKMEKFQSLFSLLTTIQTRNEGNRLFIFWKLLYQLLTNERGQIIIFQESFRIQKLYIILFCIAGMTVIGLALYDRKKKMGGAYTLLLEYIGVGYLYLAGFYVGTLPLITGMQPQHFVVVYFGMFLLLALEVGYIIRHIPKAAGCVVIALISVMGITANIYDINRVTDMLTRTEGRGKYNAALNEFAEEAYEDLEKTEKIYVFPEWGFNANFIYLTQNSCQTIRDAEIDVEELQGLLDQGYTLVIAAFQKESVNSLSGQLKFEQKKEKEWDSIEGLPVFFSMELENTAGA